MKALILTAILTLGAVLASAKDSALIPVPMPGGGAGIGFDDLGYSAGMKKVLVPGGRTGRIFLIDPATRRIVSVGGFSAEKDYRGGHGEGVTSVDEGSGLLFGTDRNVAAINAVDPKNKKVIATAKLGGHPDYVRYVASTKEVWVSEPNSEKIEIFSLSAKDGSASLKLSAAIAVPGGPESLLIDDSRGRAYANTWKDETMTIDLKERKIAFRWKNGCAGSRGLALDEKKGFLIVGCDEGKASVLDVGHDGAILSDASDGSGVDVIAYSPRLRHLYLPGAESATMAVMSLSTDGKLALVRSVPTAKGAHCVTADAQGGAWVCDPDHGRLLYLKDEPEKPR